MERYTWRATDGEGLKRGNANGMTYGLTPTRKRPGRDTNRHAKTGLHLEMVWGAIYTET